MGCAAKTAGRRCVGPPDQIFLASVSMASCSSSASRSLSPASRSTWSSDVDRRPRDGAPSCVTTHRTSPPWICSLFRPLASTCSSAWSSSGSHAATLSGSTSQQIRPQNGLHARSRRRSLGMRPQLGVERTQRGRRLWAVHGPTGPRRPAFADRNDMEYRR
jgi:hypothetical protein